MNRGSHYLLLIFGFFLATTSLWILGSELSGARITTLPTSPEVATVAAQRRVQALRAALFGGLRGDLWSQLAYTYASLMWSDPKKADDALDEARHSATRALTLGPVNASVWLFLADLGIRYGKKDPNPLECLKMSYYTGAHEESSVALRLAVVSRVDLSVDPELERLFRREVENVLSYRPSLRPAIVAAYAQASPQARQAIETTARDVDPSFAKALASASLAQ